jgi:hypothetical protein
MLMAFRDEHILWLACTVYFLAIAHTRFVSFFFGGILESYSNVKSMAPRF